MVYLVTGGAGFIGSNIVRTLLEKNETVRVLDNFSTGKRENISEYINCPNLSLIEGDIRSFPTVIKAVKGVDYILHQAALPSVQRSINDPVTTNDVNVNGTLNLLEAAKEYKVKKLVFASSSSVYGNSKALPKEENMEVSPLSPYALSKYAGERYCQIYSNIYGLKTVCLRYFNVFGPNQDPSSQYSAVIPKFIKAISQNKQPVIYGDGLQSRDFTFVDNVVAANLLACKTTKISGEVFNIACGERYNLIELVKTINKLFKKNIEVLHKAERKGDVKHSLASIHKAKKMLGYKVRFTFNEGLFKTALFFSK